MRLSKSKSSRVEINMNSNSISIEKPISNLSFRKPHMQKIDILASIKKRCIENHCKNSMNMSNSMLSSMINNEYLDSLRSIDTKSSYRRNDYTFKNKIGAYLNKKVSKSSLSYS